MSFHEYNGSAARPSAAITSTAAASAAVDDLYAGFHTQATDDLFDYDNVQHDEAFQSALRTSSYGRKTTTPRYDLGIAGRLDTAAAAMQPPNARHALRTATATAARPTTGRPTTAVRPVGYTSEAGRTFDPLLMQQRAGAAKRSAGVVAPAEAPRKPAEIAEEKYRQMEVRIQALLDESMLEAARPGADLTGALTKARETASLDRTLLRLRDQSSASAAAHQMMQQQQQQQHLHNATAGGGNPAAGSAAISFHNYDLSFAVQFNLAQIYAKNRMHAEALNAYALMVKNKAFANVNRLKVNMGNIYFELGMWPKAIKMYRMALDQVPAQQKDLRLKISHNIGVLFVRMGQYAEAATSFEFIMTERADLKCGLHLILCYYALGDVDRIKRAFQLLLEVQQIVELDEDERRAAAAAAATATPAAAAAAGAASKSSAGAAAADPQQQYVLNACRADELAQLEQRRKALAGKNILMSANLIASVIDESFNDGYTWCVEVIKNSPYPQLANELELNKAIMYLKQRDIAQAIETLKYYEKKEPAIAANAVCNLTFIYLHQRDLATALRYAEQSREMDSYNPAAFVNSGACEMARDDLERARRYFETALEVDAMCFEAIYDLGLVCKKLGEFEVALGYFKKIHLLAAHQHHPDVLYQMANLYELMGDSSGALEWYVQLLGTVSGDPGIYQKIAEMSEAEGDRQQAFQYQTESFRAYPSNLQTIAWLGSHYIDLQVAEKAIVYYEKAVLANPNDPYFLLRIAGCLRRIGNTQKSLHMFESILRQFPENADCYRALINLTQTLNMEELNQKYAAEFQRLEKLKETRQRVGSSRPTTTATATAGKASASSQRKKHNSGRLSHQSSSESLSGGGAGSMGGAASGNSMDSAQMLHSYADPLGPAPERPRTGKVPQHGSFKEESDEDFDADEMLPM